MNLEIVVARYKEDISWVSELRNAGFNVTVYNKHEGENLLPNVGRESHTYLHHIITRWENLADYTLFLQGDPFEHATDLFHQIMLMLEETPNFKPVLKIVGGRPMSILCDKNAQPHGVNKGRLVPLGKLYEWLTMSSSPELYACTPGAQFLVSSSQIKRWTKKFYERAILTVSYDVDPIEGHCFERLWPKIFLDYTPSPGKIFYERGEQQFAEIGMTSEEYVRKHVSEKIELLGSLHESYREI